MSRGETLPNAEPATAAAPVRNRARRVAFRSFTAFIRRDWPVVVLLFIYLAFDLFAMPNLARAFGTRSFGLLYESAVDFGIGQIAVFATWAAVGSGAWVWRTGLSILANVLLCFSLAIVLLNLANISLAISWNVPTAHIAKLLLVVPFISVQLQLPGSLLRFALKRYLSRRRELNDCDQAAHRFTLIDIFIVTAIAGSCFALASFAIVPVDDRTTGDAGQWPRDAILYFLMLTSWSLFYLLPIALVIMVEGHVLLRTSLVAACAGIAFILWAMGSVSASTSETWVAYRALIETLMVRGLSSGGALLTGFLFLRVAGYSLRKGGKRPIYQFCGDGQSEQDGGSRRKVWASLFTLAIVVAVGCTAFLLAKAGKAPQNTQGIERVSQIPSLPANVADAVKDFWSRESPMSRGERFEQAAIEIEFWRVSARSALGVDDLVTLLGKPDFEYTDNTAFTIAYRYKSNDDGECVVYVTAPLKTKRIKMIAFGSLPAEGFGKWRPWEDQHR